MKIIDILNKMANGTLEDGFKFCFEDEVYTYTKEDNSIRDNSRNKIGQRKAIEKYLNEEVLLFKENNQEVIEEKEEIKEIEITERDRRIIMSFVIKTAEKTNEIIRTVNKLTKESEKKEE